MIFCLVAAGCYGIEEMIPASGPGLTLVMLMVLPFVWGLPFGLVAAELGSVRPQEGGYYKWVQEALGEFWGFQAGWWRTVSIYIDNSLYVILVGGYIAGQWNLSHTAEMIVKIVVIAIFIWVNIRGIKDVGIVSTVLAIFVIVAFAMIAVCGFTNMDHNPFMPFTADGEITGAKGIPFADWVAYIGGGLAMGMWMYSGYESMSTIAGEVAKSTSYSKGYNHYSASDHGDLYSSDGSSSRFFGTLGTVGHRAGNGGIRRCCRSFLGAGIWRVLRNRSSCGKLFNFQYLYCFRFPRILCAGR